MRSRKHPTRSLNGCQIPRRDQLIATERFGHLETPPQLLRLTDRFGTIGLCRPRHTDRYRAGTSSHEFRTGRDITMGTKRNLVAIAAAVSALATPSVAAAAKGKQSLPTWEPCYSLAVEN